jgi:Zn-dependent peptidase ImmA (M78 family)
MAYTSDEEYERGARALRNDVGVDDRFCPDLIFVLNNLKEKKRIQDWKISSDDKIQGKAHYDSHTKTITLSASTFAALDNLVFVPKTDRRIARFTVAHELAHYFRGHEGLYYRGRSSHLAKAIPSRLKRNETDANRFASVLLTPFHLARLAARDRSLLSLSIEDISDLFDVSYQVAKLRKPVLERLDRQLKNEPRLLPDDFANFLRQLESSGRPLDSLKIDDARRSQIAKSKGYEDRLCNNCKKFTMRKTDNVFACETCGRQDSGG